MIRNTLITGPTNGIGRATALELAKQGHRLFLLCRNADLGHALVDEIIALNAPEPMLLIADLGDPDSVRAAADKFLAQQVPLHMLINNAGVMNTSRQTVTIKGQQHEQMFAVNHLGHFLLTRLLLPNMISAAKAAAMPSRLIIVSSEAHALFCKGLDFDDVNAENSYGAFKTYGRSKLANLLMMQSLLKQVNPSEVQINALHPGAVHSGLGENGKWYGPILKTLLRPFFLSPLQGAATTLHLATADIATQGQYYVKSKPHRVKPWAMDASDSERLWRYSEQVLDIS